MVHIDFKPSAKPFNLSKKKFLNFSFFFNKINPISPTIKRLPKTIHIRRFDSPDLFDFVISEEDMTSINALEGVTGYGSDPDQTQW